MTDADCIEPAVNVFDCFKPISTIPYVEPVDDFVDFDNGVQCYEEGADNLAGIISQVSIRAIYWYVAINNYVVIFSYTTLQ